MATIGKELEMTVFRAGAGKRKFYGNGYPAIFRVFNCGNCLDVSRGTFS
jgi:hypothetical protein